MDSVTESHVILMDAWKAMTHGSSSFESRRGGLIDMSWSGFESPFFNLAVTARPPSSLAEFEAALDETCAWAAERQKAWMIAICDETLGDLLPEAASVLAQRGMAPMMTLTGMEAGELTPPRREKPQGLWLTESAGEIGDRVIRINEAAYEIAIAAPGILPLQQRGWWSAPERMTSVLALDHQPVSCSAVINVKGIRYVAFVATLPEAQQKGYAEATMRDVLERSLAAGLHQRTYLHASAAGRPIYERMGYQATAEYTLYAQGH